MIVKKIELLNFRNYDELSLDMTEGTNILYGNNAQGKTNLLESIYICSTCKSHRGNKDKELIKFDKEEAHIRLFYDKNSVIHKIDFHIANGKKKTLALDGVPVRRAADLFGTFKVVIFSPKDLDLIQSGPSERRNFMDMEICQVDKVYLKTLTEYNNVLSQRNELLKQIQKNPSLRETLDVWDEQLVKRGTEIIKTREKFIEEIRPVAAEIHGKITGNEESFDMKYVKNIDEDSFMKELINNREKDIILKTTGCGPQRDDIDIYINGREAKAYGSQGQQRTAAFSLKMSEIKMIQDKTGEDPVLLLDDVLSELDRNRQTYLVSNIGNMQTIITCTGLEEFIINSGREHSIYKIENGVIVYNNQMEE